MKKFELTSEQKINWFGHTLYRIKACISFTTTSGDEVNAGDLGGWVEKEANLSHDGKAWVCGDAEVWGNAEVCGDANIFSTEHIFCVTPIGEYANSLTIFRTKNCQLAISFELEHYTIDEFRNVMNGWSDDKHKRIANDVINIARNYINLTPAEPEYKPCPFCGGNGELDSDADIVVCQKCGASADKNIWNERG